MRKFLIGLLATVLAFTMMIAGCSQSPEVVPGDKEPTVETGDKTPDNGGDSDENKEPETTVPDIDDPDFGFKVDLPDDRQNTFVMQSDVENGFTHDVDTNVYTISVGSKEKKVDFEYNCSGELYDGQIVVAIADDEKVVINLNGCTITNSNASPIYIVSGNGVEISAKKNTVNNVYDLRNYGSDTAAEEESGSAAIYSAADLKLKGTGTLNVVSNYNNGVHTKKDLEIQKETLNVKAVNNALKGNDSVTVNSGTLKIISSGGDAIKTKSTDKNKSDRQRGWVDILDGTVDIYAACDGIDSSSDVNISGGTVNIYTDSYSEYSGDVMTGSTSTLYIRMTSAVYSAGYKYSAYFYNSDGTGIWKDMTFYQKVNASGMPGGRPGGFFGPGMPGMPGGPRAPGDFTPESYYYYSVQRAAGYTNVKFYAYSSAQTPGQAEDYVAVSASNTTVPTASDTYVVSSLDSARKIINNSGWTTYKSSSGNTGLAYSCKGIKADNIITVSGGDVTVKSKDDGIHANFDSVLESTNEKGAGNVIITGGTVKVTCDDDGIHADQDLRISGGAVTVERSYEGLEANRVYISDDCSVTVNASDDGINANSKGAHAGLIEISGGTVDVTVPNGDTDTMDSNGTIVISGGFVFLKNGMTAGQSMMGGTIDTDSGVTVTGGTLIAIGCIGDTVSGAKYSTSTTMAAGEYEIKAGETSVAQFTLASAYKAYMFWSDSFVAGTEYTVYRDSAELFTFVK